MKTIVLVIAIFLSISVVAEITELPFKVTQQTGTVYFDLNDDDDWDFITNTNTGCMGYDLSVAFQGRNGQNHVVFETHVGGDVKLDGLPVATILNEGEEIGSEESYAGYAFVAAWDLPVEDIKQDTYFDGKREGYLGCRILDDDEETDVKTGIANFNYAWVHVLIDDNEKSVTYLSSGYEPVLDKPVDAGHDDPYATTPIPILASLLGFGVIGFAAMRKRVRNT